MDTIQTITNQNCLLNSTAVEWFFMDWTLRHNFPSSSFGFTRACSNCCYFFVLCWRDKYKQIFYSLLVLVAPSGTWGCRHFSSCILVVKVKYTWLHVSWCSLIYDSSFLLFATTKKTAKLLLIIIKSSGKKFSFLIT